MYSLSHDHQNQRLIHCVLSGSDVWRKLGLLYSPTSNNKTPALLTTYCCCYSCSSAEKMTDFLQLAEIGRKYANTGQYVSGRGRGLSNMTSYCLDNCLGFWGIKKGVNWFLSLSCVYGLPRHIYMRMKIFCLPILIKVMKDFESLTVITDNTNV